MTKIALKYSILLMLVLNACSTSKPVKQNVKQKLKTISEIVNDVIVKKYGYEVSARDSAELTKIDIYTDDLMKLAADVKSKKIKESLVNFSNTAKELVVIDLRKNRNDDVFKVIFDKYITAKNYLDLKMLNWH